MQLKWDIETLTRDHLACCFFVSLLMTCCSQRTPKDLPRPPSKKEKKEKNKKKEKKEACFVTNCTVNHVSEFVSASCLSWRAN